MKHLSIRLPDEKKEALANKAKAEKSTISKVVQKAVNAYLRGSQKQNDSPPQ